MSEEADKEILETARSLCLQFHITNYNPTSVTWTNEVQRGKSGTPLPYDQCVLLKHELILPAAMRDKLDPEEWRPIIAPILIYEKSFKANRRAQRLGLVVPFFIALDYHRTSTIHNFSPDLHISRQHSHLWRYSLGMARGSDDDIRCTSMDGLTKRLRTKADKKAAQLVGTVTFISVLEKIRGLDTTGEGRTQNCRGVRGLGYLNTIQQRIAKLQTN
jgi:hypothetical protein